MAVRIRKNGRIFCAAMRPEEPGDTYLDDHLHYELAVLSKALVTEPMDRHRINAEWWWRGQVPEGVVVAPFSLEDPADDRLVIAVERLRDEDGGGFAARIPGLPGCVGDGATPAAAVIDVLAARDEWHEARGDDPA